MTKERPLIPCVGDWVLLTRDVNRGDDVDLKRGHSGVLVEIDDSDPEVIVCMVRFIVGVPKAALLEAYKRRDIESLRKYKPTALYLDDLLISDIEVVPYVMKMVNLDELIVEGGRS